MKALQVIIHVAALGALVFSVTSVCHAGAVRYTVTDLGFLPGHVSSHATHINDRGQVVGYSIDGYVDSKGYAWGERYAFTWENGAMNQLVSFPTQSPLAINAAGHVLTYSFVWRSGLVQQLPYGYDGRDMNDQDQILLQDYVTFQSSVILQPDGTLTPVVIPGSAHVYADELNNLGEVVGDTDNYTNSGLFLWSNGTVTYLPGDTATDINDVGQVVGYTRVQIGLSSAYTAFVWQNGEYTELAPGVISSPSAINNLGQVVGWGEEHNRGFAWIWDDGTLADLNELVPANSGWFLESAEDINNCGQIVGVGRLNGVDHGFLLTLVPEPSSLSVLTLALAGVGIGVVRRRR